MVLSVEDLKKIIVGSGFVPEKEFDTAAKTSVELGRDLIDVLIFKGLINEETVGKLVSEHYAVPYINIKREKVPQETIDLVPEKLSRTYRVFPLGKEGDKLKLAME